MRPFHIQLWLLTIVLTATLTHAQSNQAPLEQITSHLQMSEFVMAESLATRVLASLRSDQRTPDIDRIRVLNTCAEAYRVRGRFSEAERLFREAVDLAVGNPDHDRLELAKSWAGMSRVARVQRRTNNSIQWADRAVALIDGVPDISPMDHASILDAWARARRQIGEYEDAERAYREALDLIVANYGPDHPEAAVYHNWLAALHVNLRCLEEAVIEADRAIEITRRWHSGDHLEIAAALFYKAVAGTFLEPEKDMSGLFEESLRMYETLLGPDHIRLARVYGYYSYERRINDQLDDAVALGLEATRISRTNYIKHGGGLTDLDAVQFSMHMMYALSTAASAYFEMPQPDEVVSAGMFEEFIHGAGLAPHDLYLRRECLKDVWTEPVTETYEQMHEISAATAANRFRDPLEKSLDTRRQNDSLEWVQHGLMMNLADLTGDCRQTGLSDVPALDDVIEALPDSATLVCYFSYLDVSRTLTYDEKTMYVAVVVDNDGLKQMRLIGDSAPLDSIESRLSALMRDRGSSPPGLSNSYHTEIDSIARTLYDHLWAPIADAVRHDFVLIAPEVMMASIPFSFLKRDDGTHLVEEHTLHTISSIHDLTRGRDRQRQPLETLLALGDPDFNAPADKRRSTAGNLPAGHVKRVEYVTRSVRPQCEEFEDILLAPLPGTGEEVITIAGD